VVEASKQCGRNRLMEIAAPQPASELFAGPPTEVACRMICDPEGERLPAAIASPQAVIAAIGPEGGFTPAEKTAAQRAGWRGVSLGPAILRVETAAIAVAAWAATTGFLVHTELPESGGRA
jgi:16S rRNA (uracil1498-N3)-methyltransferase